MKARIHVTLKPGVLDPQGKAAENALHHLGFGDVAGVRIGKYIELELEKSDSAVAQAQAEEMCEKLLANTVIERYRVEVVE